MDIINPYNNDFFLQELRRLVASLNKLREIDPRCQDNTITIRKAKLRRQVKVLEHLVPAEWLKRFYTADVRALETVDNLLKDLNNVGISRSDLFDSVDSNFLLGNTGSSAKQYGRIIAQSQGGLPNSIIKDPEAIKEIRHLMVNDFRWVCKYVLKIRPREGGRHVPFILNPPQELVVKIFLYYWHAGLPVRLDILKCRQWGCSTLCSAIVFWLTATRKHRNALIAVDTDEHNMNMRNMHIKFYEEWLRKFGSLLTPMKANSNASEIVFDNPNKKQRSTNPGLGSRIKFESAQSSSPGTSGSFDLIHLSECSKYPTNKASEINLAIQQTIPEKAGTVVIKETTADGRDVVFETEYREAVNGNNDFVPVFIPWMMVPEYSTDVPPEEDFKVIDETEPISLQKFGNESELVDEFDLTLSQLYWRRKTIANKCNGDKDEFNQEYPTTWEMAFRAGSGRYFNSKDILRQRENVREALFTGEVRCRNWDAKEVEADESIAFINKANMDPYLSGIPAGPLKIYKYPEADKIYYFGGDVATGTSTDKDPDHSCFVVVDEEGDECACYNKIIDADEFARAFGITAAYYASEGSRVRINCEKNHVGAQTCSNLEKMAFTDIYVKPKPGSPGQFTDKKWYATNSVQAKELICSLLKSELRDYINGKGLRIRSKYLLSQLDIFVRHPNGKLGNRDGIGNHDDGVIALAIALECRDKDFKNHRIAAKFKKAEPDKPKGFDLAHRYPRDTMGAVIQRNLRHGRFN